MKILDLTVSDIVERFNKWCTRTICSSLREHRQTGKVIAEKFEMLNESESLYDTKLNIEALDVMLPTEGSLINTDWVLDIRTDLKKWKNIVETLDTSDFNDMDIKTIADKMVEYPDRVDELLYILESIDIEVDNG